MPWSLLAETGPWRLMPHLPAALWPWASAIPQHQDSMILTPWISLVIQCLSHLLAEMWWHGQFPQWVQFSPNCITKNSSKELIKRLPGEGHSHKHEVHPAPLPSESATPGWKRCGPHTGPFPNAPWNRMGAALSPNLPCSNSFLPTRLPYVQNRSIARCMSKVFCFLNVIFPRIYWHPTMLLLGCRRGFLPFGPKIETTRNLDSNHDQGNAHLFIRHLKVSSSLCYCFEDKVNKVGNSNLIDCAILLKPGAITNIYQLLKY